MMNQVILVGKIVKDIELKKKDNKNTINITIAVNRPYKNKDGICETDFIDCILWSGIAEKTAEFCNKGDLVGIKGRLETIDKKLKVIADKVSFLSSKKESEN